MVGHWTAKELKFKTGGESCKALYNDDILPKDEKWEDIVLRLRCVVAL